MRKRKRFLFEATIFSTINCMFIYFAGDVAFRILETINSINRRVMLESLEDDLQQETQIYICDINPNMLNVGKKRALQRGKPRNTF